MLSRIKKVASSMSSGDQSAKNAIVALDIGTENVKALVVYPGREKLRIVGVGRAAQGLNDMQAGAIADIGGVVENCDKALRQAEEESGVRGARAVVGIAGELIKGITNSLKIERQDASLALDAAELDDMIKQVQAEAYRLAKSEIMLELGSRDVELKLVNSALVSIVIDGYKVTNPIGFQGGEIEVQLYTAFAPLVHIGAIERVTRDLDLDLIAVAAEPFAVARSVVGDNPQASMSAILIDVGGGTTDIAVMREGGLEGTRMFGIGGRSFTKAICRDRNIDFEEAEKLKLSLSGDTLSEAAREQIEVALRKTLDVWIQGVHLALAEFDWLDYLPSKILLCGGGASLQLLQDALAGEWHQDLPFSKPPAAQFIGTKDVVGIDDTTAKIQDHTMITVMGLARVGNDTLGYNGSSQTLKSKVDKVLEN